MKEQNQKPVEQGALKLTEIHKTYGVGENSVHALKGANLEFRKNEFVSILGPSGCGKTTLLNIIGGLDRYTSGDLIIGGRSTKNFNDKDWDAYRNNSIGFVFQSYNLIPHQTVLGNVELSLELSGVNKKERRQRALELLKKVGLEDQGEKKPNQLSGGQMQRVAIARALINNPQIILADEPTGALDTETSVQVMDILKEISKERLVIMVTHNPELANKYSTRIIRLLDGEITDDTNPFTCQEVPQPKQMRKPKMGIKTAFGLSLKNLISKKARTMLTSFAGSIGIIGVALVLALSNGFNAYMAQMQTDSLSAYPLTISESTVDLSDASEVFETEIKEKYPQLDNILVKEGFDKLSGMLKSNIISDTSEEGFLHYLNQMDKDLYHAINYSYGFNVESYMFTDIKLNGTTRFSSIDRIATEIESKFAGKLAIAMGGMSSSIIRSYIPTVQEMPNGNLIKEQYDLLHGKWPTFTDAGANQLVLVVDQNNAVSDITLTLLGYMNCNIDETTNQFTFEERENGYELQDVLNKKFYLGTNEDNYTISTNAVTEITEADLDKTVIQNPDNQLEIVGVIRAKKNVSGILSAGIAYTTNLTQKILNQNKNGAVAQKVKELENSTSPLTAYTYKQLARKVCAYDTPSSINIYAKDFDSKTEIKKYIDSWNNSLPKDDDKRITYADMMSDMFGMMNTMVDAITYVLIALTSVSLIVSSVMISIITYTSVVERTKEIGVLRALGASKGEISRVFNAETCLIGLFAGLFGVGVTYILCVFVNLILTGLVSGVGNLAVLSPMAAVILVVISISLTLLAGLIPARIASKKDPVVALRTE